MEEEHRENFFIELLKFALLAAVIVVPVRLFVAEPFIVSGASMVPTFENGQYLIVDEFTYHFSAPQRGEVIVFRYPRDPSEYFIKRIIGLPGDTVEITAQGLSVEEQGGATLNFPEPYVVNQGNGAPQNYTVPSGDYFVMGDNRPESSDSRSWGYVPRANIIGRVFLRLLPIQSISYLPGAAVEPK